MLWFRRLNKDTDWLYIGGLGNADINGNMTDGIGFNLPGSGSTHNRFELNYVAGAVNTEIREMAPADITGWHLYTYRWNNADEEWHCSLNDNNYNAIDGSAKKPRFASDVKGIVGRHIAINGNQGCSYDAFRVFSRFLTDAEVTAHYNNGTALGYLEET
jgi:hypothetical protein